MEDEGVRDLTARRSEFEAEVLSAEWGILAAAQTSTPACLPVRLSVSRIWQWVARRKSSWKGECVVVTVYAIALPLGLKRSWLQRAMKEN